MIIAYVGTPGSGKSYEAVKKILDNLKIGRVVYTNIDGMDQQIQHEHIKLKTGLTDFQLFNQLRFLTNEQIKTFWDFVADTPGALIVIDEVHKLFSNRDWSSEKNKQFTEWASTHRHNGYDVLLITQSIDKVDKHACSLVEWSYFYKKISHFGSLVTTKYRRYAYDSDDHNGRPVANDLFTYDKTIFPCYKSYDSATVKELGIQASVNILRHPIFYAIPVVFGLFLYFLSDSSLVSGDIFGTKAVAYNIDKAKSKITAPPAQDKSQETEKALKQERIELEIAEKKTGEKNKSPEIQEHKTIVYLMQNGKYFASNTESAPPQHRIARSFVY